jgi:hypothetical protein
MAQGERRSDSGTSDAIADKRVEIIDNIGQIGIAAGTKGFVTAATGSTVIGDLAGASINHVLTNSSEDERSLATTGALIGAGSAFHVVASVGGIALAPAALMIGTVAAVGGVACFGIVKLVKCLTS